jgi:uncharacterized protein YndB with AHSA1/START domain
MTAQATATASFSMERELPYPPAKVWRALTDPALVSQWLMPTDIGPARGTKFKFTVKTPPPWWDGTLNCEVLESVPNKKLSYSWKAGQGADELDTVVTWTLTPTAGGGTKLALVHSGFKPTDTDHYNGVKSGWPGIVNTKLPAVLAAL